MNRFTQESALAQPVRPQGVTSAQVATVCRRDWPIVVWGWRPIDRATKCVFVVRSSLRCCSEIYCPPFFAETVMAWQDYIDVMESRWKRRKTIIEQSSKAPPPFPCKGMYQSEVVGKHREQAETRSVTHWKGTQCIPFKFRIKTLLSPQIAFVGSGTVLN